MQVSTLGPKNTNSQFAAEHYIEKNGAKGEVFLYDTPEKAVDILISGGVDKTILCVVYPKLNEIVFQNLEKIQMTELFRYDTNNMVVAAKNGLNQGMRACSHPAPKDLLPSKISDVTLVSSNSYAAGLVSNGEFDVCVTTLKAAEQYGLEVHLDYGPVPMGWAVFERKN